MGTGLRYSHIKPAIKPKDGLIHTITVNDNERVGMDPAWVRSHSLSINDIVEGLQMDGYEVLNINESVTTYADSDARDYRNEILFNTLIVYK